MAPLKWYVAGRVVKVHNKMQKNYSYKLTFNAGTNIRHGGWKDGKPIRYPDFKPKYSPQTMLRMGVFEGKYCNDQKNEYPSEWYLSKKMSPVANIECNYFKIKSRLSLQQWRKNGWVPCHPTDKDTRGWFEWYMRYWLGRRQPEVDAIQIKRWASFARHYAQVVKHASGDLTKRRRQRQALLQWSWDCRV